MEEISVIGSGVALNESLNLGVKRFGKSIGLACSKVIEYGLLMVSNGRSKVHHFFDLSLAHFLVPFF